VPARAGLLLALLLLAGCAGGAPEIELTPWVWTWSQATLGANVIRYGYPQLPTAAGEEEIEEPEPTTDLGALAPQGSADPDRPGANETRLASHHYDCAAPERPACTVFLDFWLLELAPPLADTSLPGYRERFEREQGDAAIVASGAGLPHREIARDSRGREWYRRSFGIGSGPRFSHFSRPIDATLALAVTSYTTRAPDRVAAGDLARDAIDRVFFAREP
jgi:hypothetical protein